METTISQKNQSISGLINKSLMKTLKTENVFDFICANISQIYLILEAVPSLFSLEIYMYVYIYMYITCVHACSVTSVMPNSLRLHGLQPTRLFCPWDFPGKNIRVGLHALLQGIFLTQGWNPHLLCLLHCKWILYCLSHQGKPLICMALYMKIYRTSNISST